MLDGIALNNVLCYSRGKTKETRRKGDRDLSAFRKEYSQIGEVRALLPTASMVALTATATTKVISEIVESLYMVEPKTIRLSPNKINIK